MCKSWCELVIGLVIALVALFAWNTTYSKWVIVIAAIALIIHSFTCKKCFYCECKEEPEMKKRKRR
ncbi:hypothetical protein J4233_01140 [Candidatus Pacearchaeota archaeon]|nr:hypothetical protein [Candidatus Pacearchaeota archaeon]